MVRLSSRPPKNGDDLYLFGVCIMGMTRSWQAWKHGQKGAVRVGCARAAGTQLGANGAAKAGKYCTLLGFAGPCSRHPVPRTGRASLPWLLCLPLRGHSKGTCLAAACPSAPQAATQGACTSTAAVLVAGAPRSRAPLAVSSMPPGPRHSRGIDAVVVWNIPEGGTHKGAAGQSAAGVCSPGPRCIVCRTLTAAHSPRGGAGARPACPRGAAHPLSLVCGTSVRPQCTRWMAGRRTEGTQQLPSSCTAVRMWSLPPLRFQYGRCVDSQWCASMNLRGRRGVRLLPRQPPEVRACQGAASMPAQAQRPIPSTSPGAQRERRSAHAACPTACSHVCGSMRPRGKGPAVEEREVCSICTREGRNNVVLPQ